MFVIATLADRRDGVDSQVGRRRYRGTRRNNNQVAANAEDAELEDSISSEDDTVTESSRKHKHDGTRRCGGGSRQGGKRWGNRRRENEDEETKDREEGENHHTNWNSKNGRPNADEASENSEHRRHHRHRHHHHRNHTTTATTTSTLAPQTDNE